MQFTGVVLLVASAAAQETASVKSVDPLAFVVQSMEKAQSEIQLPRRITREYRLGPSTSTNVSATSDVVAEVDFTPPAKYTIQTRSGSGRAEQVVRHVLEHEIQIAGSTQKSQSTVVTTDNYDFSYLGTTLLNGRPCYLLQMTPKRKQPELISGRAWIDQQSFLILRMEGDLAKSPSWWVKSVHVDLSFSGSRDAWVQTNMEAVAQVRCFGPQKLTSRVLDYQTAPLAAKNVDAFRTSSASGSR
jgi:hypothetical protein